MWVDKCRFKSLLLLLLGPLPEVELLGHMVTLYLTFLGTTSFFPQQLLHLTFPSAVREFPISPHPRQHSLCSLFLGEVILIGVKLYLVALIYISLVTSDVGHLFVCLLVVGVSFLEKCLFMSFAHFLTGLLSLSCRNSYIYSAF